MSHLYFSLCAVELVDEKWTVFVCAVIVQHYSPMSCTCILDKSNKNPCSYHARLGNVGEMSVSISGSHDKIKRVNDAVCQE